MKCLFLFYFWCEQNFIDDRISTRHIEFLREEQGFSLGFFDFSVSCKDSSQHNLLYSIYNNVTTPNQCCMHHLHPFCFTQVIVILEISLRLSFEASCQRTQHNFQLSGSGTNFALVKLR